jgi:hypothetical protein
MTTAASDDLILFQRRHTLQSADFPADDLDDEAILESPVWVIHGDQVISFPGWQTPERLERYLTRPEKLPPFDGDPIWRVIPPPASFDLPLTTDPYKAHLWLDRHDEGWGRLKVGDAVKALAFDRDGSWVVMPTAIIGDIRLRLDLDGPHAEMELTSVDPVELIIRERQAP